MYKIFIHSSVFIFAMALSCIFNPPHNVDNNNNNPDDSITGWEWAGILSPGDSGQHIDVCHYNGNMFTFNYRGELFYCMHPDFSWSKLSVPNGDRVYCFFCDTINGLLYVSTIECGVYEYSVASRSWRNLVPNNNIWFDSTKLLDGKLYLNMYNVVIHNNQVYILTAQGWTDIAGDIQYEPAIWCSKRDTLWEKADSGWFDNLNYSDCITDFFSIDDCLYATTFERGLWCYDGVSWQVVPGTTQEEVHELSVSGGDTKSIPGFRPRSMAKYNNDIYVGNLTGLVHKMLPGNGWEKKYLLFFDYNVNIIFEGRGNVMCLYSFNGYLSRGTYYFNDSADMWFNMTPNFNKIDTLYNNGLPGTVYGMTNIGDTLFAALGNNDGKHSGVYFLDLKTRKWYNNYK